MPLSGPFFCQRFSRRGQQRRRQPITAIGDYGHAGALQAGLLRIVSSANNRCPPSVGGIGR